MNKVLSSSLKLVFGIALIVLLFIKADKSTLTNLFYTIEIKYLFFMCFLWPISLYFNSIRLRLIINSKGINVPQKKITKIYWISTFFNNFLPLGLGGDSYKFIKLKENTNSKNKLASAIILDRAFNYLSLIFLFLITGILFFKIIFENKIILSLYLIFFVTFFIVIIIWLFQLINFIPFKNNKLIIKIKALLYEITSLRDKRIIFICFLISLLASIMSAVSLSFAFMALGLKTNLLQILFLNSLTNTSELIPLSINSLGIKEGFSVIIYSIFGFQKTIVLSAYIISRTLVLLLSLTGGLRYLLDKD